MPLEGRQLAAPVDLRDLLRVGLEAQPDAIAMSSATDRITWRELEEATDRLARNYVTLGLVEARNGRPADRAQRPAAKADSAAPAGREHGGAAAPARTPRKTKTAHARPSGKESSGGSRPAKSKARMPGSGSKRGGGG